MATTLRVFGIPLLALAAAVVRADDQPLAGGHPAGDEKQTAIGEKDKPAKKQTATKKGEKKEAANHDSAKTTEKPNKGPQAADKTTGSQKTTGPQKPSEAEREQAAMALVREHHPDLVELLKRLKATKEKDYRQAVRELYRDSQRLESFRQRDEERYSLELRAWQLASRIRLLTAKLSLEDRPELQEELKTALAEQAEVRLAIRKLERDRLAVRLSKLDEEIAGLTARRDEELKRGFDRLLNAALNARSAKEKRVATKKEKASGRPEGTQRPATGANGEPPTETIAPNP